MFFFGAGFTVIYFLTAALLLPETKGKTLEEIEAYFSKDNTVAQHSRGSAPDAYIACTSKDNTSGFTGL
jgi:hypothetical protein